MAFKIYTRTGDKGTTSLFGGARVSKAHIRIESYGTIDELNSYLGLVRDVADESYRDLLKSIQDRLFVIGSNLASDPAKDLPVPDILESDVEFLEKEIDRMNEGLPELKHFILPGGHSSVSFCHIARTVCRRAERLVVLLSEREKVDPILIRYLNRLSDFLFVFARQLGQDAGIEEVKWMPRGS
jgi:cob(I)alamin adenosyltransferase